VTSHVPSKEATATVKSGATACDTAALQPRSSSGRDRSCGQFQCAANRAARFPRDMAAHEPSLGSSWRGPRHWPIPMCLGHFVVLEVARRADRGAGGTRGIFSKFSEMFDPDPRPTSTLSQSNRLKG
jgi:hypothetical protein